jgi:thiosulfate/3-mercaptopyruvate sulfurtransferase
VVIQAMPGWRHWMQHVPGSRQVWRRRLEQPRLSLLIEPQGFGRWARSLGVHPHSRIVVVDTLVDATRLWWAFHHFGKTDVQVLNGGLQAWRMAGLPVERGPSRPSPAPGTFRAEPGRGMQIATMADVWQARSSQRLQLWDTRERSEWSGQQRKRGARRAGRIPWSRHLHWREFRCSGREGSAFRTPSEMQAAIAKHGIDPDRQHIFYCQSGVRTTTVIFGLYLMGWDPAQLLNYDGSWIEWSHDRRNPCDPPP